MIQIQRLVVQMSKTYKNVAMIPIRAGSERLAKKNYLLIDGKPIYQFMLEKTIASDCFDQIVINSEDPDLKNIADKFGVDFFQRDPELASSEATSDQVVADFMDGMVDYSQPTSVFWVNTASPLMLVSDIRSAVFELNNSNASSLVSGKKSRGHLFYQDRPLNFSFDEPFAKTQHMKHALEFTYAIMAWNSDCIENLRSGIMFDFETKIIELSFWSTILLKYDEDYDLIKSLQICAPKI